MENLIVITEQNFDDALEKHKMLLIDFWAQWCAPCLSFSKVVEEVAKEFPEFVFGTIDIEKEPRLAEEFHIRSVPAVMIVRDKVILYAESGAIPAEGLRDLLNQTKSLKPDQIQ